MSLYTHTCMCTHTHPAGTNAHDHVRSLVQTIILTQWPPEVTFSQHLPLCQIPTNQDASAQLRPFKAHKRATAWLLLATPYPNANNHHAHQTTSPREQTLAQENVDCLEDLRTTMKRSRTCVLRELGPNRDQWPNARQVLEMSWE